MVVVLWPTAAETHYLFHNHCLFKNIWKEFIILIRGCEKLLQRTFSLLQETFVCLCVSMWSNIKTKSFFSLIFPFVTFLKCRFGRLEKLLLISSPHTHHTTLWYKCFFLYLFVPKMYGLVFIRLLYICHSIHTFTLALMISWNPPKAFPPSKV